MTPVRRSAALVSIALVLGGCTHQEETMPKTSAGYGSWKSPLTAARVTSGALRFDHLVLDGDDLYWIEGRASEGGRNVIVRREPDGRMTDVTPSGFNARSRVHEYGGASYTVRARDRVFLEFRRSAAVSAGARHCARSAHRPRATTTPTAASTWRARDCSACVRITPGRASR